MQFCCGICSLCIICSFVLSLLVYLLYVAVTIFLLFLELIDIAYIRYNIANLQARIRLLMNIYIKIPRLSPVTLITNKHLQVINRAFIRS